MNAQICFCIKFSNEQYYMVDQYNNILFCAYIYLGVGLVHENYLNVVLFHLFFHLT